MNANVIAACILGAAFIIGSTVTAGRYTMSGRSEKSSFIFILDRFTGQLSRCFVECEVVPPAADETTDAKTVRRPSGVGAHDQLGAGETTIKKTVGPPATPNAMHIEALYNNPQFSDDFDAKFGPGSAAQHLAKPRGKPNPEADTGPYEPTVSQTVAKLIADFDRKNRAEQDQPSLTSVQAFRHGVVRRRVGTYIAPFKITTAPGSNYFFKLVGASSNVEEVAGFIVGGTTFEVKVPPGLYELRYAAGDAWISEVDYFGPDTAFSKTVTPLSFTVEADRARGVAVELIRQRGGNLRTSTISKTEF